MPIYDFRCQDCGRKSSLTYKTYAEYDRAVPQCLYCQSVKVVRWIAPVAIAKSFERRFGNAETDETALNDLADADPKLMGRYLRSMSDATGEDLGEEFNDVVERLEKGQDPDAIEQHYTPPEIPLGGDDD
jgi:DNA-directed RNA polymerase subunit N (RpoN/RPB10)